MDAYDLKLNKIRNSNYKTSHRNKIYALEILQHVSGLRQLSIDKRFRGTSLSSFCSKEANRLENELRSAIKA